MQRLALTMNSAGFYTLCLLVLLGLTGGCADRSHRSSSPDPICISSQWPQEASDLQPDPNLTFGKLDNGLRYLLMPNFEPQQRVGIYLNVQSGSLHEKEEQRGVAHYLEHMLFNGTTHYPPGTLVEYFQSIGMGFGADTNAHTGFGETVYKLLLPSGEPSVLDNGLLVLADYARGALLLEDEVDRERGIILAEKRSRDSVSARVSKKKLQFQFSGTRMAQRDPIGTDAVLDQADSRLLRAYYDAWYRPDNLIVVVVGDMEVDAAVGLIKKHFSPLNPADVVPQCPEFGRVREIGSDVLYLSEPELGYTSLTLSTVFNTQPHPDTLAWEVGQLVNYLAAAMLDNRLQTLSRREGSFITHPRVYTGIFQQHVGYSTISVRGEGAKWQQGLSLLEMTLRQALAFGFSEHEFVRVKKEVAAYLEKQVQTASTRDSRTLAASIIRKLNNNEVILSPRQEMDLYLPLIERMTLEEVNAALRETWKQQRRLVEVVGTADLSASDRLPEELVLETLALSRQREVLPWREETAITFPYLEPLQQVSTVITQSNNEAIGVETYDISGGIRINLKQTDFQNNQVLLSAHFGSGKQGAPQEGLSMVAERFVGESGVGRLSREQLDQALAGTNVNLEFDVGAESFSFKGDGLSSEIELLLQLLYTHLADPAFRPEAFQRSREQLMQQYEQMESSVEGVLLTKGEPFLAGGDAFYGMATREQFLTITPQQVEAWLRPAFKHAPLEINIVGAFEPKAVVEMVTRYFGTGDRELQPVMPPEQLVFPSGKSLDLEVNSSIDKALLTLAWQTDDFWDISRTRRLNVLAAILDDRLRVKIREELGAAYSPVVYNRSSRVHHGYGVLRSLLTIKPDSAAELADIVRDVVAELGVTGVSAEELQRSLEPIVVSIRDFKRTNSYWMNSVLSLSSRHPEQFKWPLTIGEDFASITAEELTQLAVRYLQQQQAALIVIRPKHRE